MFLCCSEFGALETNFLQFLKFYLNTSYLTSDVRFILKYLIFDVYYRFLLAWFLISHIYSHAQAV